MHRLIAAAILLAMVVALIFMGSTLTKNRCEIQNEKINLILESVFVDKWDDAGEITQQAVNSWRKSERILSVFLKRDNLDKISLSYSELEAAVECKDRNIAVNKCALIKGLIKEIKEKEEFGVLSFL